MARIASKLAIVLTCVDFLFAAAEKRRVSDEEVIKDQRKSLEAWKEKFSDEAYLEDASLYASMGPASAWAASSEDPAIKHGRDDVSKFWKSFVEKAGSKSFKAFEDTRSLKPQILVVDDNQLVLSGAFTFEGLKGRILSQTWVRVGTKWQIKSFMLTVDEVPKKVAKVEKKIVKEEADVVEKTNELLNGTLTSKDEKKLEKEIEDVKETKTEDLDEASATGHSYFLIIASLVVCGGVVAVIAVRRHNMKYSVQSVSGPEYMLG